MADTQQAPTSDPQTSLSDEIKHVAEELYKKNFELDETNKTLSILRKIDEVVLSSVTDLKQIAQQVTDLLINEAGFIAVSILLLDKKEKKIITLALSDIPHLENENPEYKKKLFLPTPTSYDTNLIVKAIQESVTITTSDLSGILLPDFTPEEIQNIQAVTGIQTAIISPLIVRKEVIGALVICLNQKEEDLYQFQKELISRLVDVVGIAIDNALLYQRIQEANERLQSVDKLKDEFVSLASHELRTPMTAIKSYIWLMLQDTRNNLTDKQQEYLKNTYASTERLIKLVNDMLNVSRIESGRLIINQNPTSIEDLAKSVLTDVMPTAQTQQLLVEIVPPQQPLPKVMVDADKIKEVVMNLVGNSLKFTPPGGKITISFGEKDGMIEVDVKDTGKGIKQEDVPKLFQKFGLIEGNYLQTTVGQGTGLGLYLSKSIVELHGGNMWFTSDGENKGSIFSFTLKKAS